MVKTIKRMLHEALYMSQYYRHHENNTQTLAASATMSGSSIAITSFKAGREFATRTTCIHPLLAYSHHPTHRHRTKWNQRSFIIYMMVPVINQLYFDVLNNFYLWGGLEGVRGSSRNFSTYLKLDS
jgi:hypothetical protein